MELRWRRAWGAGHPGARCAIFVLMPELPEVETVVRGLNRALPGRRITEVRLGKTDFIEDPAALAERLPGRKILVVRRHGKFLSIEFSREGGAIGVKREEFSDVCYLLVHLGMTGQLTVQPAAQAPRAHTHAYFLLDDGRDLRYTDIRRFGRMIVAGAGRLAELLGHLGADPLEIGLSEFGARLHKRRARIKALLLDQSVLRGMGNIYCDETFWRARIHPARLGASLRSEEIAMLHRAMRAILEEAIALGGSSISDYVDAEGRRGEFQMRHRVYQRLGKRCFRCRAKIRRATIAGRSSYFCPRCQRAPRRASGRASGTSKSRRQK
jgi:formamidopyrimidine-DNA glycosylase